MSNKSNKNNLSNNKNKQAEQIDMFDFGNCFNKDHPLTTEQYLENLEKAVGSMRNKDLSGWRKK
jgi:hypothetical protein